MRGEPFIERLLVLGPRGAMCEDEIAAGCRPVRPGQVSWLPAEDWPDDVLVTTKGKDVRIVLLHARTPGNGAFSRLIAAIQQSGFRPVVIEPMLLMEQILRRWGWYRQVIGSGIMRQTQWRPRKGWQQNAPTVSADASRCRQLVGDAVKSTGQQIGRYRHRQLEARLTQAKKLLR